MARTWVDHEETKAAKWAVWNRTLMQDESELQQVWSVSGPCEPQSSLHRQAGWNRRQGKGGNCGPGERNWNLVSLFFLPSLHLLITLKLITSSLSVAESVHSACRRTRCWSPSPRQPSREARARCCCWGELVLTWEFPLSLSLSCCCMVLFFKAQIITLLLLNSLACV